MSGWKRGKGGRFPGPTRLLAPPPCCRLKDSSIAKYPHHWDKVLLRDEGTGAELSMDIRFIPASNREVRDNQARGWLDRMTVEEKGVLSVDLIRCEK